MDYFEDEPVVFECYLADEVSRDTVLSAEECHVNMIAERFGDESAGVLFAKGTCGADPDVADVDWCFVLYGDRGYVPGDIVELVDYFGGCVGGEGDGEVLVFESF